MPLTLGTLTWLRAVDRLDLLAGPTAAAVSGWAAAGGTLINKEIEAYRQRAIELNPGRYIAALNINVDGDYVDLEYHFGAVPFQRIRRITGYLVGTMDRFNNAKKAEVVDRVKHDVAAVAEKKTLAV